MFETRQMVLRTLLGFSFLAAACGSSTAGSSGGSGDGGGGGGSGDGGAPTCEGIDLATSVEHCGRCGHSCGGAACVAGVCELQLLKEMKAESVFHTQAFEGTFYFNADDTLQSLSATNALRKFGSYNDFFATRDRVFAINLYRRDLDVLPLEGGEAGKIVPKVDTPSIGEIREVVFDGTDLYLNVRHDNGVEGTAIHRVPATPGNPVPELMYDSGGVKQSGAIQRLLVDQGTVYFVGAKSSTFGLYALNDTAAPLWPLTAYAFLDVNGGRAAAFSGPSTVDVRAANGTVSKFDVGSEIGSGALGVILGESVYVTSIQGSDTDPTAWSATVRRIPLDGKPVEKLKLDLTKGKPSSEMGPARDQWHMVRDDKAIYWSLLQTDKDSGNKVLRLWKWVP